jgi:multicomponent Na+:H+ antiporter subunit D
VSAAASIGAAVVLPLVGALAVVATGRRANLRDSLTVGVSLLTFATVASLVSDVSAGGRPELELLTVVPGLVLAFQVEPLGMLFGLVASGLWIVTSIYGFGYMRGHHEKNQTRFFACFAIAISAALGIAFARNLFTLFLFYEILTFSTYPLVTHHGTEKAMRAGRVYLGLLVSTSVLFLLFAVVWTYVLAGTLEFTQGGILAGRASDGALTLLLMLFAFGLGKAALMPFHRWLPAAMVAPTPVSALLHAVAVVKAGVFSMLKVLIYIFGIDMLHETGISFWLMVVASFSIVVASVRAIGKDNLKARLAYSTISQLSYITLGAALATSSAVVGAALHIAMHAMGKITLFFCAGAIYVATDKTEVSQMAGLGKRMPVTLFAFFVGSLSIIGLPPGGGAWSKWYLMLGAAEAHEVVFIGVLMLSSLLSIAYLMPVVARGFFAPAPEGEGEGIREAPLMVLLPLCFTAAGCVLLFVLAPDIYALLLPIAASGGG